ncbi:MarR family transcriptional regulator [Arthrobacter sp. A2-55]|uniref:MarR family transcriptional regulator n=1 Tax=Arthrobacter sp. A2-55 TaxID=2897337 RepID=UPI00397740CF
MDGSNLTRLRGAGVLPMEPSILMNLTRSRILHMLVTEGPCSVAHIASALGLSKRVTLREITFLVDRGVVRRIVPTHGRIDPHFAAGVPEIFQEMARAYQFLGLKF